MITIENQESIAIVGFMPDSPGFEEPSPSISGRQPRQITFSSEIIRKSIHFGSLTIPIAYYYLHRETAIAILLPLSIFSTFIDVGRHYIPAIHRFVEIVFDRIIRPHERKAGLLSGATYVLVSALICVIVFPKIVTITAFSILIVSDGSSALFGRAFGKHRFFDKSLEGSLAFVISAWLVILITPKAGQMPVEFVIGAIGAVVGAIAEAASVSLRLDDNFSVPVSIGSVMWGLYYLLSILDPVKYSELYKKLLAS